jgi:formate hydrogenlyase transcriptional activator
LQTKLLRVVQYGTFERVGGQQTIQVDVRMIVATNRDLSDEVQNGNFREDLFYRLDVFPITIPPLRSRKEDLDMLIHFFIAKKAAQYDKHIKDISRADLNRLRNYEWPGNVRELENVIERSVILTDGTQLKLDWFQTTSNDAAQINNSLIEIERDHILNVLNKCRWKINGENGAAEKLALHPNTLRSKMKRLNIERPH